MKNLLLIISTFGLSICTLKAQNTDEFKPLGKPEIQIFTNFNSSFTKGQKVNKFEVTRAYLGYSYSFSPTLSGRVTLEVGNPGVGRFQLTALLKNGYLQYQKEKLTVKFGMIGTPLFDVQEQFWGYRYILKSFLDQYGMGPSNDLGVSTSYKFSKTISADAIIQNGEGYAKHDADSTLKVAVGVTVHPTKNLLFRVYYDNMKKHQATQQTIALMAGYANENFKIGAEYNYQTDNNLRKDQNYSGYSFYGTYFMSSKTNLFARYDYLNSVNNIGQAHTWNYAKDGQLFLAGFEYNPVKGIGISPNFQRWMPRDGSKSSISTVFLNVLVKI